MSVAELEIRVQKLEQARYKTPSSIQVDDSMRRCRQDVEGKQIYSAAWKWVPPSYYDLTYEQRAKILGASTTDMLCKALLMENKKSDGTDPTNPKFVLVVIQYVGT